MYRRAKSAAQPGIRPPKSFAIRFSGKCDAMPMQKSAWEGKNSEVFRQTEVVKRQLKLPGDDQAVRDSRRLTDGNNSFVK
jgi:hypothetical protein